MAVKAKAKSSITHAKGHPIPKPKVASKTVKQKDDEYMEFKKCNGCDAKATFIPNPKKPGEKMFGQIPLNKDGLCEKCAKRKETEARLAKEDTELRAKAKAEAEAKMKAAPQPKPKPVVVEDSKFTCCFCGKPVLVTAKEQRDAMKRFDATDPDDINWAHDECDETTAPPRKTEKKAKTRRQNDNLPDMDF